MNIPLIFDIKRASTTDGPGIRTVIFFKGCNLDCLWCHNPEGKACKAELAFFHEKCISCGECKKVCNKTSENCLFCGKCVEVCPTNANKIYGVNYSFHELLEIIKSDIAYYEATGGGVTFSGGECMLYPDFVETLAKLCNENGINVAIDTAGCVPFENFQKVLPFVDVFLYDIKCISPSLHKKGTCRDNLLILENLLRLRNYNAKLIIRTPVIPNYNDTEELDKIKDFCETNGFTLELLAYHDLGQSKKDALKKIK